MYRRRLICIYKASAGQKNRRQLVKNSQGNLRGKGKALFPCKADADRWMRFAPGATQSDLWPLRKKP